MANTTNFGWETPDDTDLVKDGALAMRTLGNAIDTSLVDLKGGTTGQILSKNSNTDLDYTWINNDQGDITEVQAGTGISVASGTGPVPVVTNTVATTFDAKGDLVVGTGADTFAKLTVGTNDYVLTAASGETTGLKWAAPSAPSFVGVKLYLPADQTISTGVATAVAFGAGSESIDTDAFHDTSTNNTRITIPSGKGGKYLVIASCNWVANASGYREMWVRLGASGRVIQHTLSSQGSYSSQQNAIGVVALNAGDYIQMYVEHNTGGNLNINGDYIQDTRFEAYLIGA